MIDMCVKCKGRGTIAIMVWTGAYMFKPCDCEIAKQKSEIALKRLQALHQEILENLKQVTA